MEAPLPLSLSLYSTDSNQPMAMIWSPPPPPPKKKTYSCSKFLILMLTSESPVLLPWPEKSLQPRNSRGAGTLFDHGISCDIDFGWTSMRRAVYSVSREPASHWNRYCTISHDRTAYLHLMNFSAVTIFFCQGSSIGTNRLICFHLFFSFCPFSRSKILSKKAHLILRDGQRHYCSRAWTNHILERQCSPMNKTSINWCSSQSFWKGLIKPPCY